jgi:hypothetical protein
MMTLALVAPDDAVFFTLRRWPRLQQANTTTSFGFGTAGSVSDPKVCRKVYERIQGDVRRPRDDRIQQGGCVRIPGVCWRH